MRPAVAPLRVALAPAAPSVWQRRTPRAAPHRRAAALPVVAAAAAAEEEETDIIVIGTRPTHPLTSALRADTHTHTQALASAVFAQAHSSRTTGAA
jgi:hypothetical protein